MRESEARQFIIDSVAPARNEIVLMKTVLLKHYQSNATAMLERAVQEVGGQKPARVVLHSTVDPIPTLRQFAEWITWWMAGCEALWGLIHSNLFLPADGDVTPFEPHMGWTTIVPGSGGQSAEWRFPEFQMSYPRSLWQPRVSTGRELLSDPDLFLSEIAVTNMHSEVEEALQDAVRCFRFELYLPALVMLGKASEGAWIELGLALIGSLPEEDRARYEKQRPEWSGPDIGFAKKVRDILKFFESRQEAFKSLSTEAGLRLDDLRLALLWSDAVREVRNVVHHRNDSAIRATYESASILFMSAMLHLKTLYRLYGATSPS